MPNDSREVTLRSGEALTVGELYEGLALLAISDSPPLLTQGDISRAFCSLAFDALDWAEREGLVK